jgi:hypothetical protein
MGLVESKRAQRHYEKVIANRKNCRFEDIQALLLAVGFNQRQPRKGSSHYIYTRGKLHISIPRHKPVKTVYVDRVLALLES